ncbi:MAG: Electron transport complex subunit RsxB [Phycisphaerae bacterium]|nr:Electron transport complex subunit RsxB [Phycisphaerae bacterium]
MGTSMLAAVIAMLAIAAVFCVMLVIANVKLHVEVDPKQAAIEACLPGANCGGCGLAGCSAFAKAVFQQATPVDGCTVGGPGVAKAIADILGVEVTTSYPFRPVIHCGATESDRLGRGNYTGEPTCAAAAVVGGVQGCTWGCLGFGDCVAACEYDAMTLVDGLPRIDYEKCVGCGACVRVCPREIIEQIPFKVERMMVVACSNHDPAKAVRDVCKVGCIGCSACARAIQEVFTIENNLAVINYDKVSETTDFAPAQAKCPMKSMIVFGKPLPRYEEELAGVAAVTESPAPPQPPRPTAEDMNWRG